ncbi:MAG: hypothetical protein FWC42_02580 [Proteobacteria bacterium]|nr:hypothetical protein [Pseudomonadota bacterium]MCL2309150.1 hypothetical protein [Pseudomonadota bacterium]
MPTFVVPLLGVALPLFFWWCYWQGWPFWLGGFLLLPLAWRRHGIGSVLGWLGPCAALLGVAALLLRSSMSLLYYPVLVNAVFLLAFATSLFQSQTLVERLARRLDPELPPEGVRYTRKVTFAWCIFFIVNGGVAWWTTTQPMIVWTLYNGLIAYVAMGVMFGSEWLIRRRVMRRFSPIPPTVPHE